MYTPKFIRRSAWSIAIGLDDLTVYCELDGRVYRVISNDENVQVVDVMFYALPDLYPSLFLEHHLKTKDFVRIDIVCDFAQLPPFPLTWNYCGEGYVMRNPDLSCVEQDREDAWQRSRQR